jgi:hypothetical protein
LHFVIVGRHDEQARLAGVGDTCRRAKSLTAMEDVMPEFRLPVSDDDAYRVKSTLMQQGVSPVGAEQLLRGSIISDQKDRAIIAVLVGKMLTQADPAIGTGVDVGKFFRKAAQGK